MTDVNLKMLKDTDGNAFVPFSTTDAVFKDGTNQTVSDLLDEKQAALVSGTNIKTINNESLLGAGNITVSAEDEIAISTTEPTGNEILWINPNETPSGIGSYISNTYGESQAIGYSQEYVNEEIDKLKAYSLYNNTSGSNGEITLSDSCVNYSYIEILFMQNQNIYNSVKVYNPNNKEVSLMAIAPDVSNSIIWFQTRVVKPSGNKISTVSNKYGQIALASGSGNAYSGQNFIFITKVIGYK